MAHNLVAVCFHQKVAGRRCEEEELPHRHSGRVVFRQVGSKSKRNSGLNADVGTGVIAKAFDSHTFRNELAEKRTPDFSLRLNGRDEVWP